MASPGGTSSGSSSLHSEENPVDMKKRKRMLSNRESARRSRMRKQKHLDNLMEQATNLRAEKNHILTSMDLVNQLRVNVESENFVLRAQLSELSHRLQSLDDIIACLCGSKEIMRPAFETEDFGDDYDDGIIGHVTEAIMASPQALFMY